MQYRDLWLALVIGNSRLHWGLFDGEEWLGRWDTPHMTEAQMHTLKSNHFATQAWQELNLDFSSLLSQQIASPPLWVASVVDTQLRLLIDYAHIHVVDRQTIPLQNTYATLGVDRALSLLGAGLKYGWPALVIDCGTALTFTAGNSGSFWGGAILPGLRSQFRALHDYTDQLPLVVNDGVTLPTRWARTTPEAILSGIIYTQLAGIEAFIADWLQQFPQGNVLLTGGDSSAIGQYLRQMQVPLAVQVNIDPNLMFWGLQTCRQHSLTNH